MRCGRITATVLFLGLIFSLVTVGRSQAGGGPPPNPGPGSGLAQRVAELEAKVAALEALTRFQRVEEGDINGLSGPHVIFEGANIHVRSGSGATDDGETLTGLGNLIVGYNEKSLSPPAGPRTGSHNLVVGPDHSYTSHGGFVAGLMNTVSGPNATVSGGHKNTASGDWSSISGGGHNEASEHYSSVSGGSSNTARGWYSSVSAGLFNSVWGYCASITGGYGGFAWGYFSNISGGGGNTILAGYSTITGGRENTARGPYNTISGGRHNETSEYYSTINGGEGNVSEGWCSTVSGGHARTATDIHDWAAGSLWEDF